MLKALAAALCAVFFMCGMANAQGYDADVTMHGMSVGGVARSYGLYVPPSYDASRPAPLIVALHARFSSAKAFHAMSGLRAMADARGEVRFWPDIYGRDRRMLLKLQGPSPPLRLAEQNVKCATG